MKIHSIEARDKKYDECVLAHRTTSFSSHHLEMVKLRTGRYDYDFQDNVEDLEDCPECGLPLSEHGSTTEIDTLESCIERDGIGDL